MRTIALLAVVLASHAALAQTQITFESLLREMLDREAIARLPDPSYTCRQFSSYDRRSTTHTDPETWFANDDVSKFLRVEDNPGRREWVMAEMDGPGAVVRIWSANPKGTLRIYLDGHPQPVIESPMTELLGGTARFGDFTLAEPFSGMRAKGYNLYLPVPYAQRCKITSDSDGFYYQVNYRTYDEGTNVQSLATQVPERIAASAPGAAEQLMQPAAAPASLGALREVKPGESYTLPIATDEQGAVRVLAIKLEAQDAEQATQSTVLELVFDGESTVWCPVGAFFGSGLGFSPLLDRYRSVSSGGEMICAWVMPFRKSAEARLWNLGKQPIRAAMAHQIGPWTWDDRSMHFHARWRFEHPVHVLGARGTADWNYVDVQGQGVYVGDTLSVMNPVEAWWGEGDEKIWVDGEKFPSHIGTGTEDYYGYAWCSNELFQHPFHSQPRCDGGKLGNNWGWSTVSRVRALDCIPFQKSLSMNIELWHWKECDVAYAATSFFYARPGAKHNRTPLPKAAAAPVIRPPALPPPFRIQGALECEDLKVVGRSEGLPTVVQDMRSFGQGKWSGEKQLWVQARQPGDFVELEIPAPGNTPIALAVHATRSWDYGIVRFSVNGRPSPDGEVDLASGRQGQVAPSGALNLGTFTPRDGRLILRAELVGKGPAALDSGAFFGLDCIVPGEPKEGAVAPGTR